MKRISFSIPSDLLRRYLLAHEFYIRELYPDGGGPGFIEFISLCAELSLMGLEAEMSNRGMSCELDV